MGNIVGSKTLEGNVHYFVFAHDSKKIPKHSDKTYLIKFELLEDVPWLALGLSDKKIVEENNFVFAPKNVRNNGFFFMATNNVLWHCIDLKQRKKVVCPPSITKIGLKNNMIEIKYTPSTGMLLFYVNSAFIAGLYDVKPVQSEFLIPSLVFLKNCYVKTTFEYP